MAGNAELIDEIIDTGATTRQFKTLSDQLQTLDDEFVKLTKDLIAFSNAAANANGFKEFNTAAAKSAEAQQKIIDTQQKGLIVSEKLRQEQTKTVDLENRTAKSKIALESASRRGQAALEKAAAAAQTALSPFQQLSKQLDDMRAKAKDVAVQFGVNSKEFEHAQKPVIELDKRLK